MIDINELVEQIKPTIANRKNCKYCSHQDVSLFSLKDELYSCEYEGNGYKLCDHFVMSKYDYNRMLYGEVEEIVNKEIYSELQSVIKKYLDLYSDSKEITFLLHRIATNYNIYI